MTDAAELQKQIKEAELFEKEKSDELQRVAAWMMEVSGKPEFEERQAVYYPLLNEWRAAKRVLQLMDSDEDAPARYSEFVAQVAAEEGVSITELEKELDNFI